MTAAEKVYEELTELGFFTRYERRPDGESVYVKLISPFAQHNERFFERLGKQFEATKVGHDTETDEWFWNFSTS